MNFLRRPGRDESWMECILKLTGGLRSTHRPKEAKKDYSLCAVGTILPRPGDGAILPLGENLPPKSLARSTSMGSAS
jgi:hypothetical protein